LIIPVPQTAKHDANNSKVMGLNPRECINWMQWKTLWIRLANI